MVFNLLIENPDCGNPVFIWIDPQQRGQLNLVMLEGGGGVRPLRSASLKPK